MVELSNQLVFLVIFLTLMALVVVGTLVFVNRVDRSLANEESREQTTDGSEANDGVGTGKSAAE